MMIHLSVSVPFNRLLQKGLIALSGLLWVGFLLFHLGGNWLLLDVPGKYNQLAAALTSWRWLFHSVEILLLLLLLIHIGLSILIRLYQRPLALRYQHRPQHRRWLVSSTSRWMLFTGPLILLFLIVHLQNFRFQGAERNLEHLVYQLFHSPFWVGFYELALIPLGLHLAHGVGSGLQSLGFGHPNLTPWLPRLSVLVALLLVAGYAPIPIAIYLQSR
ncbi:MAG: hypothetical protein NZL92_03070 [Gloeomargarita sp. SKYG116]|nr:hypothetical protein [Gloeomargarita sp. SKYG116]MDW8400662.1 hypothetical protein [Gloeomargarita sp. SKYGB_i_bin116]